MGVGAHLANFKAKSGTVCRLQLLHVAVWRIIESELEMAEFVGIEIGWLP